MIHAKTGAASSLQSYETLKVSWYHIGKLLVGNDKGSTVKNFWYLFTAYTIIWTALFAYVIHLSKKNRELRDELYELQARVERLLAQ